ncbi:TIGR01777 family oxidoreductase [Halalkalibacter akibai]|uniref:Cell division inhibitor n=1 Tax=Halalkalibacter akibai (strain ATCC 43226 / DSM 21942 / CIP 109018 / JCM 9157 / 1139) TaxID=1236973 RepID=W4QWD0_HALA3|nr:TIGR01777 family oxidoreductase [Halalkalibacter akibai]GAE36401.1 cell division inhibitor [Halalkalibacter akibai JCM 9157]
MKIAIAGGTGFIGSKLTTLLTAKGHSIYILTRDPSNRPVQSNVRYVKWLQPDDSSIQELEGIDAIINLAGESIGSGRWTTERKNRILQSRIQSTQALTDLIKQLSKKPSVLVNASAIGYYGNSYTETFNEASAPVEDNFLSTVVQAWEKEAQKASEYGVRVVYCRLGVVLDRQEGALPRMLLPYRLFAGGSLGDGKQWLSWIHIDDAVRMFEFALENQEISGPFNVTAPEPYQMSEFGKIISRVINRPHWLPTPSFALKVLLGEMSTLVLDGQKVIPEKAKTHGFRYSYPALEPALTNLLKT